MCEFPWEICALINVIQGLREIGVCAYTCVYVGECLSVE